ncbi:MAG: hypothetical protein RR241_06695, partial [Raoultibacter sp.]
PYRLRLILFLVQFSNHKHAFIILTFPQHNDYTVCVDPSNRGAYAIMHMEVFSRNIFPVDDQAFHSSASLQARYLPPLRYRVVKSLAIL